MPYTYGEYLLFSNPWDDIHLHQVLYVYSYILDNEYVYLNDKNLTINAWGCGKSVNRQWFEQHYPAIQINGIVTVNNFMNIITTNGPGVQSAAANAGLPGITQTTIDQWLANHGNA